MFARGATRPATHSHRAFHYSQPFRSLRKPASRRLAYFAYRRSEAPTLGRLEAFRKYGGFVDTKSYKGIHVVSYPDPDLGEKNTAPYMFFVHGYPGSAGDGFYLAPHFANTHRVRLVDLVGHGRSKRPRFFDHRIGTQAKALHEILEACGLKESDSLVLVGNSVGAEIINRYILWRVFGEMEGPQLTEVHPVSPMGQLLTEYQLYRDVHWDFLSNVLRRRLIGPALGSLFGNKKMGLDDVYKVLFKDPKNPHLADYMEFNDPNWIVLAGAFGRWGMMKLLQKCSAEEHRIFSMGRRLYTEEVIRELGAMQKAYKTEAERNGLIIDILRDSGARFHVVIPDSDKIYTPNAQRAFFDALVQTKVVAKKTEIKDSGHMAMIEQDEATAEAIKTAFSDAT